MSQKYKIRCLKGGEFLKDNYTNKCQNHNDSLLRSEYNNKKFQTSESEGIWKYSGWLPVYGRIDHNCDILTYKSKGLAKELGLKNLYIVTCGYIPERGNYNKTGTFKELEALPSIRRAQEHNKGLILASAGNTGRAFAYISSLVDFPVIIVIPKDGKLWIPEVEKSDSVKVIRVGGDYTNAGKFASRINFLKDYVQEGGARNIARRDGMGTIMLDAVRVMNKMPSYYFQAIGSGTGAISVWEASLRLMEDGRFGIKAPELHLSQNFPYVPLYNAWKNKKQEIGLINSDKASKKIEKVKATMLTNRKPPYSLVGGLYDALKDTNGKMYSVTNGQLAKAQKIFEENEGYDIAPEAGVAVYSLIEAVEEGNIKREKSVLINITGAGYKKLREDFTMVELKPDIMIKDIEISSRELENQIRELVKE